MVPHAAGDQVSVLLILLGIAAIICYIRSTRRPSAPDIALVSRSPELHTEIVSWHKQQHDTFAQRHTFNFDCSQPARAAAPIDYLAPYWPKDVQ